MKPIFTKHKTMTVAKRLYKPQFFMLNEGYNSYPIRILWVLFRSTSVKSQEKMLFPSNARPLFSVSQIHTHMQRKKCRHQGHHLLTHVLCNVQSRGVIHLEHKLRCPLELWKAIAPNRVCRILNYRNQQWSLFYLNDRTGVWSSDINKYQSGIFSFIYGPFMANHIPCVILMLCAKVI